MNGDSDIEDLDDFQEERVSVAHWRDVAGGLAEVFKVVVQDAEAEAAREKIDVRSWQQVGSRLAMVFAEELEAEEEWEAPARLAGIRTPPGLEAPLFGRC